MQATAGARHGSPDKWAQENPDALFKMAARLIPQQREVSGPDGGPIRRREVREYSTDELYALLEAGGEADSRQTS